jgi:hypothetical protein
MHRGLFAALAACSFPLAIGTALAAGPAAEGTVATVKFRVTVQEKSAAQFSSTAIARVLSAQCTMVASPPMQVGFTGPTAEQEAAAQASAAQAEAMAQPNTDLATMMAAEAEKCGDDEACLTAMVMQFSQSPEFLAEQENLKASAKAALAAQPNLGPVRYQQWHPQSCTGELQVNDTYVTSDPGGEGGDGAYTDTVTVSATGTVSAGSWLGLFMETDAVNGTTQYRITPPAPITFPSNSSITGAGSVAVSLLGSTALPDVLGPYPGLTGGHKGAVKGKDGSISLEWSTAQ